jgi:hypothetical protein
MKQASNYVAWNDPGQIYWVIDDGSDYPRLAWEGQPGNPLSAETFSDLIPDGFGTSTNPYQIRTARQLNAIGLFPSYWDKVFALQNDIDMCEIKGTDYNIIGRYGKPFKGVFQGNHNTIRNLTYQSEGHNSYVGMFGQSNGDIKNLRMQNVQISTKGFYVGSIVGWQGRCIISRCRVNGNITGGECVGGLVGWASHSLGSIDGSSSRGNVIGAGSVGGLVGRTSKNFVIDNCYSISDVIGLGGESEAGGLVGMLDGIISNSYSAGRVTGESKVGGLVAYRRNGSVATSFWDIQNSGMVSSAGGTGLITGLMFQMNTYMSANWDFMGEVANGTDDIWWIDEGNDYPRLWFELNTPPFADVGLDITVYAWIDGLAEVQLDGTGSYDADGDLLEYFWYDGNELIATGADPNVVLGVGEHVIDLIVNDGIEDSEPDSCVVTVIESTEP